MVALSLELGTLSAAGWLCLSPVALLYSVSQAGPSCQRDLLFNSDKEWPQSTGWRKAGGKVGEGWQAVEALNAPGTGCVPRRSPR